ncbi:MAG: decarboxylase, partial [Alphaproteobacteria bacterium]|nr:decarboxylase [Alphaproteobacteria bacterium]
MSAPRGSAILAALKTAGIEFVVALPDIVTSDGLLWPLARQNDIRLVRICKEDEGIGICAGLGFAGKRSILMMQQTGLMDSVNALRAVGVEYEQPIAMLVGLQGQEPG